MALKGVFVSEAKSHKRSVTGSNPMATEFCHVVASSLDDFRNRQAMQTNDNSKNKFLIFFKPMNKTQREESCYKTGRETLKKILKEFLIFNFSFLIFNFFFGGLVQWQNTGLQNRIRGFDSFTPCFY